MIFCLTNDVVIYSLATCYFAHMYIYIDLWVTLRRIAVILVDMVILLTRMFAPERCVRMPVFYQSLTGMVS